MQRGFLLPGDYQRSRPHRAVIDVGRDKLELNVSALNEAAGQIVGPLVTWSVVTDAIGMTNKLEEIGTTVSAAATGMNASFRTKRRIPQSLTADGAHYG